MHYRLVLLCILQHPQYMQLPACVLVCKVKSDRSSPMTRKAQFRCYDQSTQREISPSKAICCKKNGVKKLPTRTYNETTLLSRTSITLCDVLCISMFGLVAVA